MNEFQKLGKMSEKNMDISLAPLSNISEINVKGKNGFVTIGVPAHMAQRLMAEKPSSFVGGLILADRKQFDSLPPTEAR